MLRIVMDVDRPVGQAIGIKEALEAFRETFRSFAQLCVEDADGDQELAYTKESIDREAFLKWAREFYPNDKVFASAIINAPAAVAPKED